METWGKLQILAKKIKRLKYRNCNKNVTLLTEILKDTNEFPGEETKMLSRKIMNSILRSKGMKEIIRNNHVHSKHTYLIAAKVYALRCKHSGLTDRVKSA